MILVKHPPTDKKIPCYENLKITSLLSSENKHSDKILLPCCLILHSNFFHEILKLIRKSNKLFYYICY